SRSWLSNPREGERRLISAITAKAFFESSVRRFAKPRLFDIVRVASIKPDKDLESRDATSRC
ncbi:MAG: hypothetical protein RL415_1017, partial [Actinomycetota bacterium]